ncbi:MAG: S41 family peptidase [Acidobacteriota bacterium]
MLDRSRLIFLFASTLVVTLIAGSSLLAANTRQSDDEATDSPYKYLGVFMEVFSLISKAYVDEPDDMSLLGGAFEGAVDALDPFSLYVPAERVAEFEAARVVGTGRSGLLLLKDRGVAFVVAVEDGSPAAEAGLRRGDILPDIDGRRTRVTPLDEINGLLAGAVGTTIPIERLRQGEKRTVEMVLGEYDMPSVAVEERRGVPVLRIPSLRSGAALDVENRLQRLVADGAPEHLIIDLRGVAGGLGEEAYAVAQLFAEGDLGSLLRRGEPVESFDGEASPLWSGEMVVLADRGTQGPAEILVSVLRQKLDAEVVGESTFGHSGQIDTIALSDGSLLQITRAFYTGPDGVPIDDALEPDHFVRVIGSNPNVVEELIESQDVTPGDVPSDNPLVPGAASPSVPMQAPAAVDEPASGDASSEGADSTAESDDAEVDDPAGGMDPVLERALDVLLTEPDSEPTEQQLAA